MGKRPHSIYLSNALLLREAARTKENGGKITPELLAAFQILVKRVGDKFKYRDEMDREDCAQEAMHNLLKHGHNFDLAKGTNAFAYFTQIAKMGYAFGFDKLHPNLRHGTKVVSMDIMYKDGDSLRDYI